MIWIINQNVEKLTILANITYCFLKDIHEGYLSSEDTDNKQSLFPTKIKSFNEV